MSLITEELMAHESAHALIGLYRAAESRAARMRLLLGAGRELAMAEAVDAAAGVVLQHAMDFSGFRVGCLILRDETGGGRRVCARLGDDALQPGCEDEDFDTDAGDGRRVLLRFGDGERVSGVLSLTAIGAAPRLDEEDRDALGLLLANFAAMARIARQNDERAGLHALLQEREAHLDDLVGRLISTQEDERKRLSIELHDGLAQVISSAHQHLLAFTERCGPMDGEALPLLEEGLRLIRRAASETRLMMADLRPTLLDDFGIGKAIGHLAAELRGESRDCRVEDALGAIRLLPEVEIALFRVTQEALRNVRKHAPGARVVVSLGVHAGDVRIRIRDDGPGFPVDAPAQACLRGERLGLLGMQERMRRVGGVCAIASVPGQGTTIEAWAPMPMAATAGGRADAC